jgi:hypothetical protein
MSWNKTMSSIPRAEITLTHSSIIIFANRIVKSPERLSSTFIVTYLNKLDPDLTVGHSEIIKTASGARDNTFEVIGWVSHMRAFHDRGHGLHALATPSVMTIILIGLVIRPSTIIGI